MPMTLLSFRSSHTLARVVAGAGPSIVAVVSVHAASPVLEEIVVTARRQPVAALATPLSIGRVDRDSIELLGATHSSEALNRVPGVMVQRGSGQESLTAIRSPVLTGAGSCGAFLFLENGVPIRPVGFCNVNEMLEINTEQADAIEIVRGTGIGAVRFECRARHDQRAAGCAVVTAALAAGARPGPGSIHARQPRRGAHGRDRRLGHQGAVHARRRLA